MLATITAIASAIAAVFNYMTKSFVGLAATIYKDYFSPATKRKKQAHSKGEKAIDEGNKYDLLDSIQDSKR